MDRTLDCLAVGQKALVTGVCGTAALCMRLKDYGLIPGTQICCRYRSPDGSVTSVECRGSVIAIRTKDMKNIKGRW